MSLHSVTLTLGWLFVFSRLCSTSFLIIFEHACLTGGSRVTGKKKEVVSLFFCVVCCPYVSSLLSTYIYLGGCLIKFCLANFRYLSFFVLFFPFIYFALHVYLISPDYDTIGRLSVFSLLNSRIPNKAFYPA